MSYWIHVARKDFGDAIRSTLLWALSAVMIALAIGGMFIPHAVSDSPAIEDGITALSASMLVLVPVISLAVGYRSVVGERETGSIRLVLGLPIRRGEYLLGTYVGRTAVVTVPVVVGFTIAAPAVYSLYGSFPIDIYGGFVAQTLLTALVYVAIAVGISASVDTRGRALGLTIGLYFLFDWLWATIPMGLYYVATGGLLERGPVWYEFLLQLAPAEAIRMAVDILVTGSIATDDPLIVQEWVGWIIVILWILVPLAIGRRRFDRAVIT